MVLRPGQGAKGRDGGTDVQVLVAPAARAARYDLWRERRWRVVRCGTEVRGISPARRHCRWITGCVVAEVPAWCRGVLAGPAAAPSDWVWVSGGVLPVGILCIDAGLGAWTRGESGYAGPVAPGCRDAGMYLVMLGGAASLM